MTKLTSEEVAEQLTAVTKVPKTDAEKIDWLWKLRDIDHAKVEELQTALKRKDTQLSRVSHDNRALQKRVDDLTRERDAWVSELNNANQRAMNAVQEYIQSQEG